MATNPYEVLRLSPTASEREIMMRVRRPFAGADISLLQQAMQEVRFSAEKRAFYELATFHAPVYDPAAAENGAMNFSVQFEAGERLERFCTAEFAATLGPALLHYLLEHISVIRSEIPRYEMGADEAFSLAAFLANTDIWLLHDMMLLTQRYLQFAWHRENKDEVPLAEALNMYLACLMRLVGEANITAELHCIHEADGLAAAEAGMRLFLDDQLECIAALLASAVSASNTENLISLAGGWFEQRERWRHEPQISISERWFERIDAIVAAELNRLREKVLASGVEREGISGMHGASLEPIDRLLSERKVRNERLIEILLDGYTTWLNEYINAGMTRHAVDAVQRLGDICKKLLAGRITAKLKDDVRAATGRAMYVTYDQYNQAMEALNSSDLPEALRLMKVCQDLTASLPDEASITVHNVQDKTKTEITAKSMYEKVTEELRVVEMMTGVFTSSEREQIQDTTKPPAGAGRAKSGQTRYGTTKISDTGTVNRGTVPQPPASTPTGAATRTSVSANSISSGNVSTSRSGSRSPTSSGELYQAVGRGFTVGFSHIIGVIGMVNILTWFKDLVGALEGFVNAGDIAGYCYEGSFYLAYGILIMAFVRNAWVCIVREYSPWKAVQLASALFWMLGLQELAMLGIGFAVTWIGGRFIEGGTALPFLLCFGIGQLFYGVQTHSMMRQVEQQ